MECLSNISVVVTATDNMTNRAISLDTGWQTWAQAFSFSLAAHVISAFLGYCLLQIEIVLQSQIF